MLKRLVSIPILLSLVSTSSVALQTGAKSLFYGQPASSANPTGPVGFHYWFEDAGTQIRASEAGARVVDPRTLAVGTAVRLHIVVNTDSYIAVWLAKGSGDSRGVVLTPSQERYAGYRVGALREHIIGGEIRIPPAGDGASVLILMARSQSEIVSSAAGAREKIRSIAAQLIPDGGPSIVQETDTGNSSETGTYVVNRRGAQPGIEIPLGP
jgi:hypothetical protein